MKSLKLIAFGLLASLTIFGALAALNTPQAFAKENEGKKIIHLMAKLHGKEIHGKKPMGDAKFMIDRGNDNKRTLTIHIRNLNLKDGTEVKIIGCGNNNIGTIHINNMKGSFNKDGGPVCFPDDVIKILHNDHVVLRGKFEMKDDHHS